MCGYTFNTFFCLRKCDPLTWSPNVDIHAAVLDLALRRRGGDGGDAQVSSVQVLLSPLPMVRLVVGLQYSLIIKLLNNSERRSSDN